MLAEVLGECQALAHLEVCQIRIRAEGLAMLVWVLGECKVLARHWLDLGYQQSLPGYEVCSNIETLFQPK
eukprot:1760057-Rhodomonas_salina.1